MMLTNLRSQVVALSVAATRKLIGDTLAGNESQQKALLEEFFSGIRKGKLEILDGENLRGETVEVTSALPLSNAEQETIRKELSSSTGNDVSIQFRVDPSILGGLVLRAGDRVIDGSISAKLQELETSLR